MAKTKQAGAKAKARSVDLQSPPEGKTHLRIRAITNVAVGILNPKYQDGALVLRPQQEVSEPIENWSSNRYLLPYQAQGLVEVEWVDRFFEPRRLPSPDEAPEEALPELTYDRAYAWNICLTTDEGAALNDINAKVIIEATKEPDIRFLKGRMTKVLRFVEWLEPQVQDRPRIKAAVKARLAEIRTM